MIPAPWYYEAAPSAAGIRPPHFIAARGLYNADAPEEDMMRSWILLAAAALLQADTGESFCRFPKGTSWTYRRSQGDTAFKVVMTVTDQAEGRLVVESREYAEEGKEPRPKTLAWAVEEGFLLWGEFKGGKIQSPLRVYKIGSKKGDTWKSPVGEGKGDLEATHMGTVEVKVPAGTYRDAVQVAFRFGTDQPKPLMEIVLAPKVGMVRFGGSAGSLQAVMELEEFKEGK